MMFVGVHVVPVLRRVYGFVKDNLELSPTHLPLVRWQNYPIIGYCDWHDGNLFFNRCPKSSILKGSHHGFMFSNDTPCGKDYQAFSFVERLHGFQHCGVTTFESSAIDRDM